MSDTIRKRLAERVVVCDGAMGSELLGRLPAGALLDLAPHQHPAEVLAVHLAYLEAGAELIETASFAASRPRLARDNAGELVEAVNSAAVKLARQAREISGRDCLVAGSIGPLAGVIDIDEPDGLRVVLDAHREQAEILAGRGADLLILETFFRLDELRRAVAAVREVTDLPLVAMMTFPTERPPHTYSEQAAQIDTLAELELLALGVNCSPGPMGALEILRATRQTATPLAAMPNAGVLSRRDGRIFMPPATPTYLARFARQAAAQGASLVGGCCGTGPDHIAAIAEALRGVAPVRHRASSIVVEEPPRRPRLVGPQSGLAAQLGAGPVVRLVQLDPPKGTSASAVLQYTNGSPITSTRWTSLNPGAAAMDAIMLAVEVHPDRHRVVPHAARLGLMGLQSQLLANLVGGLLACSRSPAAVPTATRRPRRLPRRHLRACSLGLTVGRRRRLRWQPNRRPARLFSGRGRQPVG
jgi:homocysteine S-methyltransferase